MTPNEALAFCGIVIIGAVVVAFLIIASSK